MYYALLTPDMDFIFKERGQFNVKVCASDMCFNSLEPRGNYSPTSNNMKLVHWPLMDRPLHLVQRGGDWAAPKPT